MCSIEFPDRNQYLPPITTLFSLQSPGKKDIDAIAAQLVSQVTTAPHHATALWELWGAFFSGVVSTTSPSICTALLLAVRSHPPTRPRTLPYERHTRDDNKLHWEDLPLFGAQWRDEYEALSSTRDWDGVGRDGVRRIQSTGGERYLNFVKFSASWLKVTGGDGGIDPVFAFLLPRNVIECEHPEAREPDDHHMSSEELWALDVKLAAIWIRDGARAVWNMDLSDEDPQDGWGRALSEETELWPRTDGPSRERWQMWVTRLRVWSLEEDKLDERTRALVLEAVEVVEGLLKETASTATA